MRQLFVPACLCLMTFSGSTANDPKLSLEEFTGRTRFEKFADHAVPQSQLIAEEPAQAAQADGRPEAADEPSAVVAVPSDRPIEIPTQTEIEPVLAPVLAPVVAADAAPPPPAPKPVVHRSREEVCDALVKAAQRNDLPIPYFIRLLFQESGFKPDVVSHAGAQGVAQFMPETAASVGLKNPFDPLEAIPASARLLRSLFQQFGNLGLAAAAYNAGPKRIEAWLSKKGTLPQETQGYVKTITGRPPENWKTAETGVPQIKLPRRAPCQEAAGLMAWNGPARIPMPLPSPRNQTTAAPHGAVALRIGAGQMKSGATQLAARKIPPVPHAKSKTLQTAQKLPPKPLRLAIATHSAHK